MRSCNGVCALILCAGSGTRTELAYNKILHTIGKKTVLEYALDAFVAANVVRIVVCARPCDRDAVAEIAAAYEGVTVTDGGDTRTQSVRNGLAAIGDCGIVAIHDGARPFVTDELIRATVRSAREKGSGIAAVPATDTVKEVCGDTIERTLPREKLWCMQTPQTFRYREICDAYARVPGDFTDDAEVYARAGYTPHIVRGDYANKKITTATDLWQCAPAQTAIGTGFDVHPLVAGRPLILGGVTVPHEKGLYGHSDADVLTHAVMDALLSAAGLPDIGVLFPDTDSATLGISSLVLLQRVRKKIADGGYTVGNISAVVMAQKPKLMPHIPDMRRTLAQTLGIAVEQVNVSATTTERLGIVGEEKGIAASAVCLLQEK